MKKLNELTAGARFIYGGVEWVKLSEENGAVLALAAETVFERAFDDENVNNWESSSLRKELNGTFLEALIAEGAEAAAFAPFVVDLTADDGMTNYGSSTDKIALLSCEQYRKFRSLIPKLDEWWWTVTPWSCDPEYSYSVRGVNSSGALSYYNAYYGSRGVRPLCNLLSDILVSVPGEEETANHKTQDEHENEVINARDAILELLAEEFDADVWGDALGAAVASLLNSKIDTEGITLEDCDRKAID